MVGLGHSQVDVHEKKDYISVSTEHLEDNSLYTSISKLAQFFMEEVEYVDDLRAIAEKKLLSADSIGHLGTYIASFEDVVGNQDEDEVSCTFLTTFSVSSNNSLPGIVTNQKLLQTNIRNSIDI